MVNIEIIKHDEVQVLMINRPARLNALNNQTLEELSIVLDLAREDDSIRVLIITGSGEKAFVAGADIKEFADYGQAQARDMSERWHKEVFDKIEQYPKPVIAAINGFALGGGLELALACHIRYAADTAKLGLPEVTLGLIPGYGGTQRLPKLIGKGAAFEMILSANIVDGLKAASLGLVNAVFSQEALMEKTLELAHKIASNSPMGIREAIRAIHSSSSEKGYAVEIEAFGRLFDGADKKEGVAAFMEKRKPQF